MNKNQSALQDNRPTTTTDAVNSSSNTNHIKWPAQTDDTEEDPILKEGYLPEIYFSLKSDNPADW